MNLSTRWARCWCLVAALGVGLAVLQWSALAAAMTFVAALVCVATVTTLLPSDPAAGPRGRRVLVTSLVVASWLVALLALVSASPPLALLVVLLAVTTSPPALRLVRRGHAPARPHRARRAPRAPTEPPVRTAVPPGQPGRDRAVQELDDRQLCTLWRQLFWQLGDQRTAQDVVSTVAWRQACLDELARRDPAAVRAWLESGARASGGPERFLTGHGHPDDADAA